MFTTIPEAQQMHQDGLQAELSGDYGRAHAAFEVAQMYLEDLPQTVDIGVQSARIARDDGFTYVRSAIQKPDVQDLDRADDTLEEAGGKTFVWILRAGNTSPGPEKPVRLNREQWRELLAEHGATVSLMGRLATVREVMTGEKDEYNPPSETYETAHSHLVQGSNGYYRVSNAMVAARHERINRNYSPLAKWLGRAATGVAWTALFDTSNLAAARRTFGSRLGHLRSREAAIQSVTRKP